MNEASASDPDNPRITVTLAEAQAAKGNVAEAETTLGHLPADQQDKPEVVALRNRLFFAGQVAAAPAVAELEDRLNVDPDDRDALHQLALRKVVDQDYDTAVELLLKLMQQDRDYGDDAARRGLLKVFEVLGNDPRVSRYRSRMASLLH